LDKFVIKGGTPLRGEVQVSGAKNAAVAIIPATILAGGPCLLENIPDISDVYTLYDMLSLMGATVRVVSRTSVFIDTSNITSHKVPEDLARQLRASYYFLGALLGRCSEANVPLPGGCDFGVRPIDQHIKGFEALGANVNIGHGSVSISTEGLLGSHIYFDVVSVGATINVMLAAVKAKGLTVLENVAKEPHIVDLANFLNSLGADIRGAGTDVIKIHGVEKLHGANYSIIPDQIEAGTYMVAAAATKGNVLIRNVIPKHLEAITEKLVKTGASVIEYDDAVRVSGEVDHFEHVNVKTMPYPGFPTDMQPQMTTLLALAEGTSIVTEGVWDNRFKYISELCRMGASISVDGKVAVVQGVEGLSGACVRAADLRAGAAMVIAGLAASGTTEIEEIHHIERGYTNLVDKLRGLGANISRVSVPEGSSVYSVV